MLLDRLPGEIFLDGRPVPICTNFRNWILFEQLSLDASVSPEQKAKKSMRLVFPDLRPLAAHTPDQIVEKVMWFYKGGDKTLNPYQIAEEARAQARKEAGEDSFPAYYDYDFDADYIYSAFLQQYGVDLGACSMHWWKFRAMFAGLTDQTRFVQIMGYRATKIDNDMTNSQKKFYRKMKRVYALPVPKDEQEKTKAIEDALQSGDVTKLMQMLKKGGVISNG